MKNKAILVILLSLISTVAQAQSKVSVLVLLTPAGSFTAVSDKMKGEVVKSGNQFTADRLTITVESFKTGIRLRDEHFCKHFNPSKFPKATLSDLKGENGKATANLEVNGVKKPVMITYQEKGNEVEATMRLKASDFALPPAKYLGIGVKDEVKVDVVVGFEIKK